MGKATWNFAEMNKAETDRQGIDGDTFQSNTAVGVGKLLGQGPTGGEIVTYLTEGDFIQSFIKSDAGQGLESISKLELAHVGIPFKQELDTLIFAVSLSKFFDLIDTRDNLREHLSKGNVANLMAILNTTIWEITTNIIYNSSDNNGKLATSYLEALKGAYVKAGMFFEGGAFKPAKDLIQDVIETIHSIESQVVNPN